MTADGCRKPHPPGCWSHEEFRSRKLTIISCQIPGTWRPFTHANCVCNQLVGITNRVLGQVPLPTKDGLKRLKSMSKRLYGWLPAMVPWTLTQVVDSFTDSRKKVYERARLSLETRPFDKDDAKINAFVKSELVDPNAKINPDPRIISARTPRYNTLLASYLRPFERCLLNMKSKFGLRIFAKGQNSSERAQVILDKFRCFPNTVCFSIDASRWDQHVSSEILEIEHSIYKRAFPNDPFLQKLLDYQIHNRCRTREGVRYTALGRRMSGDMNTGLGNCILMVLMLYCIMWLLGIPFEVYDDGDDCLLFIPNNKKDVVREALVAAFLEFGQEIKLENEAQRPEDVVFCQSKMLKTMDGWKMVRNWKKVLSHGTSGIKHWNNPKLIRPMMTAVGSCELALNRGVPILQAYSLALKRIGEGKLLKLLDVHAGLMLRAKHQINVSPDQFEKFVYAVRPLPISGDTRLQFADSWGVPIWEQLAIEARLSEWDPPLSTYQHVSNEVDSYWRDTRDVNIFIPDLY